VTETNVFQPSQPGTFVDPLTEVPEVERLILIVSERTLLGYLPTNVVKM
jgi:hypothetical protein